MLEEFKIRIPDGVTSVKFQNMMFDRGIFWKFHQHKYKPLYTNEQYLIVKDDLVLDRLVLVCADEDVWNNYEAPEYKISKTYTGLEAVGEIMKQDPSAKVDIQLTSRWLT